MSLRGFSSFEAKFRAKMAKAAPTDVMVAKQVKDGLTNDEVDEYQATFKKFDVDDNGTIDTKEFGKLIRILGFENIFVSSYIKFILQVEPIR